MATVSGSVNYEDSTPIPEQQEYTPSNIQPIAIELAKFIRTKAYGVDVREALAQWVEFNSAVLSHINEGETENTNKKLTDMEQRMNDKINRITLGTDEDTIRLVVMAILQEQGVIK